MNETAAACAAFFRERPAYHRILELLLRKYRSFGRPAGTICLPDAAPEECDAARSLFGRPFSSPLRIRTAEFEAALQSTPFQGVTLKEVLECYFHTEIRTKKELQSRLDTCMEQLLVQVGEAVESEICRRWLEELHRKRGEGYPLVRQALQRDGEAARRSLLHACRSADWLEGHPGERVRLAVLSACATSDPHALDLSTLGGKLFLHFLAMKRGVTFPAAAETRAQLYYDCGILCDSISSLVTQVGLRLYAEGEEHPAYRAFRLRHEAGTLTLTNLAAVTRGDSPSGRVYLVENQMVFTQLCDRAAAFRAPLICTSGQPSVAAIRLLDMLAAAGTDLFYSGDFDGKGLFIARQLLERYPVRLHLWHMAQADYDRCGSDVRLSDESRSLLQRCGGTALAPIAETVGRSGFVGYQELLLPQLQADLTEV